MTLSVECNTDAETLRRNVAANSKLDIPWIDMVEPHDGHAVIVGSGASVADELHQIRWRKGLGQTVFALNNSARFLIQNGIIPDYQVVMDAREENKFFLQDGLKYLLASQCSPGLITMVDAKSVQLWHFKDDEALSVLPKRTDYMEIGGGITVGLSSMCLAYVMGYRKIHCFGYDSSYSHGSSHVLPQVLNRNEDRIEIEFDGTTYDTTVALAKQAEEFQLLASALTELGCIITVDGDGLLPAMVRANRRYMAECEKYKALWTMESYRAYSPGEHVADLFVNIAQPKLGETVLDLGCGTGRGGKRVKKLSGCEVLYVDFADNCLDDGEPVHADLTDSIPVTGDYAFCCDVMEHIPTDDVDKVLANVCKSAPRSFFQIALEPDSMGALIGQQLHLSVFPASWWMERIMKFGRLLYFQDHGGSAVYYVATNEETNG